MEIITVVRDFEILTDLYKETSIVKRPISTYLIIELKTGQFQYATTIFLQIIIIQNLRGLYFATKILNFKKT